MKKVSKKVCVFLALVFSVNICFSQNAYDLTQEETEEALEVFDEDFDSMFDDAQDTTAVVVEEPEKPVKKSDGTFPLKFSGHLDSEFGVGYIYHQGYGSTEAVNKPNGYFTFTNYLYMSARPNTWSTIHGTFAMGFPSYTYGVKECYFDYIVKNMVYITGGKKATTWGYPRLFTVSSNDNSSKSTDYAAIKAQNTNILSDSGSGTTFMLRVPFWTGTITGLCLYNGSSSQPSFEDMKFAGSIEFVVAKISLNFFARKETEKEGTPVNVSTGKNENGTDAQGPLFGFEAKRTILGADVYGQALCRFDDDEKFKQIFKGSIHKDSFERMIFTGGFYKWWDAKDPAIGFNLEYQGDCIFNHLSGAYAGHELVHRLAFDGGVKRLGPKHNIKVGLELNHNITQNSGYLKPGVIISGIFPGCDLNTGFKWFYGKYGANSLKKTGRWEIGAYFDLDLNY